MIGHWMEESLLYRVTERNRRDFPGDAGVMTQSSSDTPDNNNHRLPAGLWGEKHVSMPAKGKWLY